MTTCLVDRLIIGFTAALLRSLWNWLGIVNKIVSSLQLAQSGPGLRTNQYEVPESVRRCAIQSTAIPRVMCLALGSVGGDGA